MNNNRCVVCGCIVPEGRLVCPKCAANEKLEKEKARICLTCDKKRCFGNDCTRYKQKLAEIKRGLK